MPGWLARAERVEAAIREKPAEEILLMTTVQPGQKSENSAWAAAT